MLQYVFQYTCAGVADSYTDDTYVQSIIAKLILDATAVPRFS